MTKTLSLSPDEHRYAVRTTAEFLSESAGILHATPPRSARLTITALAALIACAIGLAVVMPIERVVSAKGRVASQAPHTVVQPLETSIIRQIHVREGQVVKAGDMLATLDPTFSQADQTTIRREVASLTAEVLRLRSEIDGTDYLPADGDSFSLLQRRFFQARRSQYQAALESYRSRSAALSTNRAQLQSELDLYRQRLALSQESEAMKAELVKKKFASRADALQAADLRLDVQSTIAELDGQLQSNVHELGALKAQEENYVQQWRSDAMSMLVTQEGKLNSALEQLAKADKRHDLIGLRAPQDAVVLQIGDISIGSVVETAQKMFILVPADSGLEVEAEISTQEQGYIQVGQEVEIKLDAWPYARHGSLRGRVRTISADSLTVSQGTSANRSVYLAKIDITDPTLKTNPSDFRLIAGMTLTADVVVGDQTVAAYLFDRVVPVVTEGMREP